MKIGSQFTTERMQPAVMGKNLKINRNKAIVSKLKNATIFLKQMFAKIQTDHKQTKDEVIFTPRDASFAC